jgi:hypothetical protein
MIRRALVGGKITSLDNVPQGAAANHIQMTLERWYAINLHLLLFHPANVLQAPTKLPEASAIAHRT